ncbi:ATP-grasp domain-containing protein [Kitasatospora atroaurantiaca]|uniref:ATP-grasp domain-containing protein n=1 Tax=Kitasatospora atroaurantiaca TaxID=285545 RepID=A0A561ER28_9ACTN|nr:ATP-grasp domain-containing protein [Kitasatospora atroaurantiaca]TWE18060.1 ATP-grasp domain-containing protein [Kitasatospora atroaurantiaca]
MSAPVRVWLNRTYAENVFFIDLLRDAPRPVEVHATHVDPDSPVLAAADFGSLEPDGLSPEAYVEFALEYCARHRIDVFLPRLCQLAISLRRRDFEAIGTALVCPPASAIAVFESKVDGYAAMDAIGLPVPPWYHVRTADELLAAVQELEADGTKACLKPASGAGGEGFRVLTREPFSLRQLAGFPSASVQLDAVAAALEAAEDPADLLVMPYLEGPEVSVDCLADPGGRLLASVGRTKQHRRRSFTTDPGYLEPTRLLIETFGVAYLSNVQFRHHRGAPVLLDINTRPSGGLHQLRLCGLNLPWAAVQLALGETPALLPSLELLGSDYTLVSGVQPVLPRQVPGAREHRAPAGLAPMAAELV